jgi:flagellar hook-associated protein 3 FlgL
MVTRITNKTAFIPYQRNLAEIQSRQFKEQTRIASGQQILSLDDNPVDLVDIKQLSAKISEKENYLKVIENSLAEMKTTSGSLENIADSLMKIRNLSLDGRQITNQGNTQALATYIKGIFQDIVNQANSDFNGKLLFSGTRTTVDSIKSDPPAKDKMPFELIEETPSTENPSGMKVIFKGNENDRIINKDGRTTEVINAKSSQVFGADLGVIGDVINIYNLFTYNTDGTKRGTNDALTKSDIDKLDIYQKNITNNYDKINKLTSDFGTKIDRMESIHSQMEQEVTRLNEYKSLKNDTDIAKSSINLKMEETAMQYSLQIGSRIMQNSLFDFLK